MSNNCKIYYSGSCKAPYNWITTTCLGTNRIIYVTGGEGGYQKEGIKTPFKKDCLYLIPGSAHFVSTYTSYESDDTRLDHIYANFEVIPPIVSKEVYCIENFDEEMKVAMESFKLLCTESEKAGGFVNLNKASQRYLSSTVKFLVDKIAERFNLEIVKDKLILKALQIMHNNIGKKQQISEIAEECYLSTNGFIKRFKREVGETPYSYLKKLKIRTAQNMRMYGATLDEIAEKCGYSDPSALLHAIGKKQN